MLPIKTHFKKASQKLPFTHSATKTGGFTIAEVLISLSIIALLASVGFSSMKSATDRARAVRAIAEMDQISSVITFLRHETKERIRDILPAAGEYDCPECPCRITDRQAVPLDPNLKNIQNTDECAVRWENTLAAFKNNGFPLDGFGRDPWGSPYLFDPNEGESAPPSFPGYCDRYDAISTAGPDGVFGKNVSGVWYWGDDDLRILIPHGRFAYDKDGDGTNDAHCYGIFDERLI